MNKLVILAIIMASGTSANAATYVGSRTVGGATATLSITTDDTLGVLTADNLLDWTVALSSPSEFITLSGPLSADNSSVQIRGSALSATASQLTFDFSLATQAYLLFQSTLGDRSLYCVQTFNCFDQTHGEEIISFGATFTNFQRVPQSGVQLLATTGAGAVPEPTSWALMLSGIGLVGAAMRRRASIAYA